MYMYEEKETGRVEGFSDHVFAIAMTLLVIEIQIPSHELVAAKGLAHALAVLWPSYLAFLTSFFTILVIWVHHHWIFGLIRRIDQPFLYCNGLLLLFVAFVPFPTALISEYSQHPELRVAAIIYTGTFLIISLVFDLLWRYASKRLLPLDPSCEKKEEALQITKQYRFAPPLYFATFGFSFVFETLSLALCLLLAMFFALGGWPIRK
jgi:uncharacterized membrane protein